MAQLQIQWKPQELRLSLQHSTGIPAEERPGSEPPSGAATHRFSGSVLKGSALISRRLMTEPPGNDPDIPGRTAVGKGDMG